MILERRYHVPRSQVWAGSRGRQSGNVHLHLPTAGYDPKDRFHIASRTFRAPGQALCGKRGWYERNPEGESETSDSALCPRCAELASRIIV